MSMLKGMRDEKEDEGMKAFVGLIEEMFGKDREVEGE
jgi:hypothetical protein